MSLKLIPWKLSICQQDCQPTGQVSVSPVPKQTRQTRTPVFLDLVYRGFYFPVKLKYSSLPLNQFQKKSVNLY